MNISNIKPNFYQKTAKYINNSPKVQKILHFADANPTLFNSSVVFMLATILRPSAILMMPNKSKDGKKDNLYSSARSIATGFVDLTFASIVFIPINKIIDKSTRVLFEDKNSIYFQEKEMCSAWKSIANRGLKILLLPIMAYLNFKYTKNISEFIIKTKDKISNYTQNKRLKNNDK